MYQTHEKGSERKKTKTTIFEYNEDIFHKLEKFKYTCLVLMIQITSSLSFSRTNLCVNIFSRFETYWPQFVRD